MSGPDIGGAVSELATAWTSRITTDPNSRNTISSEGVVDRPTATASHRRGSLVVPQQSPQSISWTFAALDTSSVAKRQKGGCSNEKWCINDLVGKARHLPSCSCRPCFMQQVPCCFCSSTPPIPPSSSALSRQLRRRVGDSVSSNTKLSLVLRESAYTCNHT
jgi:hypothetical protein